MKKQIFLVLFFFSEKVYVSDMRHDMPGDVVVVAHVSEPTAKTVDNVRTSCCACIVESAYCTRLKTANCRSYNGISHCCTGTCTDMRESACCTDFRGNCIDRNYINNCTNGMCKMELVQTFVPCPCMARCMPCCFGQIELNTISQDIDNIESICCPHTLLRWIRSICS